ncbi:MAG: hypothetical protein HWN65_07890 [Candidatus Helarchaeota archaeon]|nr:hypothetical protein [Candidatus Helarchaeota archaeon]
MYRTTELRPGLNQSGVVTAGSNAGENRTRPLPATPPASIHYLACETTKTSENPSTH